MEMPAIRQGGWLFIGGLVLFALSLVVLVKAYALTSSVDARIEVFEGRARDELANAVSTLRSDYRASDEATLSQIKQYIEFQVPVLIKNSQNAPIIINKSNATINGSANQMRN
ncbi:hypothetical protein [Pseudomonas sp. p1(2021b)]|uniref:hypothetical protein n=1 Tax=Pseudomonas sp. p1(2021b) TaxID=2874628 RepID=UPI003D2828E5